MTEFTTLLVEPRGAIEILSLNRPESLNALSPKMIAEMARYFDGLLERLDVRVVILRSNGRAFCAGAELGSDAFADTGEGRPQRQMLMQKAYSGLVRRMRACPQPIICLVQGPACGGGFSLALASDVRIAAPNARFNAAYLKVGLGGCDMGAGYLLPRLVGLSIASELLMTGRFIHAERAFAVGLVSEIAPEDKLLDAGLALAGDMLTASPMGLRMTKETLNAQIDAPSLDAGLLLEDRQQVILLETADHREAVTAFKGKRTPVYRDS